MLRLSNLSMELTDDMSGFSQKSAKILGISPKEIKEVTLARQSVDARNKGRVRYHITLDVSLKHPENEEGLAKKLTHKQVSYRQPTAYQFPEVQSTPPHPVVVGAGPAGLFCALTLARNGVKPLLIERGADVDTRSADVDQFWKTGVLNERSNVQFGEGGAGTFSDGKLTTGTKDPRISEVLRTLVEAGAPADILYTHKPHIGTDVLRDVLKKIRAELISFGCDIRFHHQLVDIVSEGDTLTAIEVETPKGREKLPCTHLVLAVGHSARDTFEMLCERKLPMEQKSFAIGARIEHLQEEISLAQYGQSYKHLPPSDYKLACHLKSGRSVFSFCGCPGGVVVAATSKEGHLVTNGMSYRKRDGINCNSGLLVGVDSQDFAPYGKDHPLAGMYFQEHWEKIAYQVGGGGYVAPAQRVGDFLKHKPSTTVGEVVPTYAPSVKWGSITDCLPEGVSEALAQSLPILGRKVAKFDCNDAVLTGIETRSSSPVRILRNEKLQSTLIGVFPCGEGAGYAGGIMSAAVDGIRVAEAMTV